MAKIKLTKANIDGLHAGAKDVVYWDDAIAGFGLGIEKERHIRALDHWNSKAKAEKVVCPVCGASIRDDDREV